MCSIIMWRMVDMALDGFGAAWGRCAFARWRATVCGLVPRV